MVGLVGINIYVFFFNHRTAPREVLNLQSTTKTMETSRHEVLAADAREAREADGRGGEQGEPEKTR